MNSEGFSFKKFVTGDIINFLKLPNLKNPCITSKSFGDVYVEKSYSIFELFFDIPVLSLSNAEKITIRAKIVSSRY